MAAVAARQHGGAVIGPIEVEEGEAGGAQLSLALLEFLAAAVGAGYRASCPLVGVVSLQAAVEAFEETHTHSFPWWMLAAVAIIAC